ncbi:MAG TPA: acyl-CoA desaturase [Steroidobacteraceae bacterium]|nr:acyl-CoA desaturase [Steroidobacteraceae bacterium]
MLVIALVAGPMTFTLSSALVALGLTYLTLWLGHSVGMHRRLIHRTYKCNRWLDACLVYVGVIVGVAGPFGVLKIHDLRDWAQRQPQCHDFFAHRRSPLLDLFWQLNCRFVFENPPLFLIESETLCNRWYRFLERTWMLHQVPIGYLMYLLGGWSWVVWGVAVRVSVSVIGHWSITFWCHNPGMGRWDVRGAGVQASNLPGLGLLTYGECWHNNHHAFPESARIGLDPGQADPGWWLIRQFERLGWAWEISGPRASEHRDDLVPRGCVSDSSP